MLNPDAVWKFLSVERYKQRWPLIPEAELLASSVSVSDSFGQKVQVLLHKRRVDGDMTCGNSPASVCRDCYYAFSPKHPKLCKFSLANDLWLGRPDPLLWQANMTHEMCLALARTVATKVVLRAGGAHQKRCQQWQSVGCCFSSEWLRRVICLVSQWRCQACSGIFASSAAQRRYGHHLLHRFAARRPRSWSSSRQ